MTTNLLGDDWVPEACTLPTVDQPLRRAEFDDLFAQDVLAVVRESPHRVRLELRPDPAAATRAAGLAVEETGCCSFFTFDLSIADGELALRITTAPAHQQVLVALASRAEARMGAAT
jgi:hypothetical protein